MITVRTIVNIMVMTWAMLATVIAGVVVVPLAFSLVFAIARPSLTFWLLLRGCAATAISRCQKGGSSHG